jgi:hypothetical protein
VLQLKTANAAGHSVAHGLASMCFALSLAPGAARAADEAVSVELNKLEPQDQTCRAYIVVNNESAESYTALKLDLVAFQTDGVIGRRFIIDLAPVRPNKRSVKLFDLEGMNCDRVGSVLVNEVAECKNEAGPVENCFSRLKASSLAKAPFSK